MKKNENVMNYVYWRGKEVFKSKIMSETDILTVFQVENSVNYGDHIVYHCYHNPQ